MIDKYRLAFEISPVPMLLVSQTGEIVLTNAGLDEMFEYEPGELIGQNVEVLVPEAVRAHHPELRNAYMRVPTKRGMGQGRDLNGITRSGHGIPLELGLDPVISNGEKWALVVALDIRQRKIHEARMHLAMDAAASAMVMVNAGGQIVFINKAAERLFGYDEADLMGQLIEVLIPEDIKRTHPVYRGSFMSTSIARPMGLGGDLYARHRDGNEIPVEIALTPVETPEGKMVMSTIIDLSERVAAERAMAAKSEELAALNIELSHFAYSASHDLKAPLSTIAGLLNFCIEDLEEGSYEDVRENLEKAIQVSQRSARKVESVLKVARVGRDGIEPESFVLERVIQEIWQDLTAGSEEDLQFTLALDHEDPVLTELPTLKIILENIMSNAVRYRDERKSELSVEVRSKSQDGFLHVTIADNGIGIPEKNQDHVFDMFNRLDDRSGDGLGLALVRKQIDRLGGTISVASKQGVGSQFTFTLPLMEEDKSENPGFPGR